MENRCPGLCRSKRPPRGSSSGRRRTLKL